MKKYFVSYQYFLAAATFGFGSVEVSLNQPISDLTMIKQIQTDLLKSEPTWTQVIILHWQPFEVLPARGPNPGLVNEEEAFDFPVRTCVHCGCTTDQACAGGCHWVEEHQGTNTGVCSQCELIRPGCAHTGDDLILQERLRQIHQEGHTLEHDDTYTHGQLAGAAATYLLDHLARITFKPEYVAERRSEILEAHWPWDEAHFKSGEDAPANLAKAGALIAAEIDRVLRARGPARTGGAQ